jgi:O-antigen ligase
MKISSSPAGSASVGSTGFSSGRCASLLVWAIVLGATPLVGYLIVRDPWRSFLMLAAAMVLPVLSRLTMAELLLFTIPFGTIPLLGEQLTASRLVAGTATLYYLGQATFTGRMGIGRLAGSHVGLLLIMALVVWVSALASSDPQAARRSVLNFFTVGVLLVVAFQASLQNPRNVHRLQVAVILLGIGDAALTLAQVTAGYDFLPSWYFDYIAEQQVLDTYVVGGTYSGFGLFFSRGYNALFLLLPYTLLLSMAMRESLRALPLLLGGALLMSAAVLATFSRAGIALLLGVPVVLFLIQPGRRKMLIRVAALVLVVSLMLPIVLPESVRTQVEGRYAEEQVSRDFEQGRLSTWLDTLGAWLDAPLFGIGLGNLADRIRSTADLEAHNAYLDILAETGLVGLAVWLLAIAALLRRTWLALRRGRGRADPRRELMPAFLAYLLAVLAYGLVGLRFHHGEAALLSLAIAVVGALSSPEQQREETGMREAPVR